MEEKKIVHCRGHRLCGYTWNCKRYEQEEVRTLNTFEMFYENPPIDFETRRCKEYIPNIEEVMK